MKTCLNCSGAVGEPGKAYGFAGKWCHCLSPVIARPAPIFPPLHQVDLQDPTKSASTAFLQWLRGYLDAGGKDMARIESELKKVLP